ncbi:MAG TPA: MFS transporter [Solirubrobacteraceae bacterium]|nr:MFS transporter [Solirubrobacteraceae bacterium]
MTAGAAPSSPLAQLDEAKPNRFQMKIMLIAGLGFFTDAYDLFVIGVVVAILKTQWHLTTPEVSLLSSMTLAASAVGAILFGRVADILGRKRMYTYGILVLAGGAIASALSPTFGWLIAFRIILGIGIGGNYPVSATMMSEFAGKRTRGQMVGLVFSMQAAGLIVGPLVAVILLASGVSHELTWRLLLGLGAIPGLGVYYLRRRIHETPRFALAGGDATEAAAAIAQATGQQAAAPRGTSAARRREPLLRGLAAFAANRTLMRWLIGASLAWFAMDFAYYGNTIASPGIIKLLSPHASLTHSTLVTLLIFVIAAAPGYVVAIALIDRIGRRPIQCLGFAVMALMFGLIALIPSASTTVSLFVVLFGISYFFTEFGPNMTTFVYPAEIFPVQVRTSGHGIAVAAGKMGAFAGTYLFPVMLAGWGIRGAEGVAAVVAVAGLALTAALLPEPKGKSLEELTAEAAPATAPPTLVPAQA